MEEEKKKKNNNNKVLKLHENPSSGSRVVPVRLMDGHGQTDRHDEGNSRFSQACERA